MDIKSMRIQKGLTQRNLAVAVKVSLTAIQNWEAGVSSPNKDNEKKLREVLFNGRSEV